MGMIPGSMKDHLWGIINHYGSYAQEQKCAEECSELIRAIIRDNTFKYNSLGDNEEIQNNLLEEVADVYIMVMQMALVFGENRVGGMILEKLARTEERMKDGG